MAEPSLLGLLSPGCDPDNSANTLGSGEAQFLEHLSSNAPTISQTLSWEAEFWDVFTRRLAARGCLTPTIMIGTPACVSYCKWVLGRTVSRFQGWREMLPLSMDFSGSEGALILLSHPAQNIEVSLQ